MPVPHYNPPTHLRPRLWPLCHLCYYTKPLDLVARPGYRQNLLWGLRLTLLPILYGCTSAPECPWEPMAGQPSGGSEATDDTRQTLSIHLLRLSTPTNHLSEPPWVATVKLAGSLVAGLEHYDLQATHST